jgi:hypothetical protein
MNIVTDEQAKLFNKGYHNKVDELITKSKNGIDNALPAVKTGIELVLESLTHEQIKQLAESKSMYCKDNKEK